ncbi:MAG: hypothetical protein LBP68_05920, partial [Acidobacteriota bacterium]|nr:hypothetical protein [Acidobacteriota bacterium]
SLHLRSQSSLGYWRGSYLSKKVARSWLSPPTASIIAKNNDYNQRIFGLMPNILLFMYIKIGQCQVFRQLERELTASSISPFNKG